MNIEELDSRLKLFEEHLKALAGLCVRCETSCKAQEDIVKATADLRTAFHDVLQIAGLYSQVSDVLRGLQDRVRNLTTAQEHVSTELDRHNQRVGEMTNYFKIMKDRLDEYINCPLPQMLSHHGKDFHKLINPDTISPAPDEPKEPPPGA